jgi:hypothetical protein
VSKDYELDREAALSGFILTAGGCAADVIVFAFTTDGHTRLLPHSDSLECPDVVLAKKTER